MAGYDGGLISLGNSMMNLGSKLGKFSGFLAQEAADVKYQEDMADANRLIDDMNVAIGLKDTEALDNLYAQYASNYDMESSEHKDVMKGLFGKFPEVAATFSEGAKKAGGAVKSAIENTTIQGIGSPQSAPSDQELSDNFDRAIKNLSSGDQQSLLNVGGGQGSFQQKQETAPFSLQVGDNQEVPPPAGAEEQASRATNDAAFAITDPRIYDYASKAVAILEAQKAQASATTRGRTARRRVEAAFDQKIHEVYGNISMQAVQWEINDINKKTIYTAASLADGVMAGEDGLAETQEKITQLFADNKYLTPGDKLIQTQAYVHQAQVKWSGNEVESAYDAIGKVPYNIEGTGLQAYDYNAAADEALKRLGEVSDGLSVDEVQSIRSKIKARQIQDKQTELIRQADFDEVLDQKMTDLYATGELTVEGVNSNEWYDHNKQVAWLDRAFRKDAADERAARASASSGAVTTKSDFEGVMAAVVRNSTDINDAIDNVMSDPEVQQLIRQDPMFSDTFSDYLSGEAIPKWFDMLNQINPSELSTIDGIIKA